MKTLLSILVVTASAFAWAAEPTTTSASSVIKGEVLEVKEVESYTYLRLKTKEGETWAAVGKAPVKKGATVTIEDVTVMNNFESKSLKQTFQTIAFGSLAGAGINPHGRSDAIAMAHSSPAMTTDIGDVQVTKASGANAWTVAEIITKAAELKDKPILVRGKVVKYNPGIMGKNWVHLRDGTGSAAVQTNDLLVTTLSEAKVGGIVTVSGIVRTDKDFGSGYAYKVIVEEATLR
jgi:hypothetical protein